MAATRDAPWRVAPSGDRRLSLLLVEDHALVREGTRELLARDPTLEVVGQAERGVEAVALAERLRPDVVLLDVALPDINGIEVTRRLRAMPDAPFVVILTAHDDSDYVLAALEAGATGYLLKTIHALELTAAVWACARGEVVLHPLIAHALAAGRARSQSPALTEREVQVLDLAAQGLPNKQIAGLLSVSVRTVEALFSSAFNKLGASNRAEAVAQATVRGLLQIEPRTAPG